MDDKTAISAWLMICISCITSCTTRYPDLPYFLFGHSMVPSFPAPTPHTSARSCRCNLLWYGRASRLPGGCGICLRQGVDKIGPHANADLLFKIGNGVFNAQFKNPRTNVDWISTSEENLDRYLDDPLCGFNFKLGGTRDVVRILMEVSRKDWAQKCSGSAHYADLRRERFRWLQRRGVLAVSDNLELAGNEPTVILYPNDRHEILNENDHERL